jgi:hypothetical protein
VKKKTCNNCVTKWKKNEEKKKGSEEDLRYLPQQGTPVEAITTNKQETLGEGGAAGRKNFATKPKRGKKKEGIELKDDIIHSLLVNKEHCIKDDDENRGKCAAKSALRSARG